MRTIRSATASDAAALSRLARAAYAPYVPRIGREPAPMAADYAAAIAHHQVWVAEDADGIAGLLVLVPAEDHVLLENIAVHPRAQGTGAGRALMGLAEERTRALNLAELRLYTNEAMVENLAYYRRHGYRETHRGVEDGFRRVYFSKRLG